MVKVVSTNNVECGGGGKGKGYSSTLISGANSGIDGVAVRVCILPRTVEDEAICCERDLCGFHRTVLDGGTARMSLVYNHRFRNITNPVSPIPTVMVALEIESGPWTT